MSEPMVSHHNVGFFLLSREVARFVKVVQSGQGADEIFGGYHWYPPMMRSRDAVADYAAAVRRPPSVTGTGEHSIRDLIGRMSRPRGRQRYPHRLDRLWRGRLPRL